MCFVKYILIYLIYIFIDIYYKYLNKNILNLKYINHLFTCNKPIIGYTLF